MSKISFEYACQECGRGTVKETVHPEYGTKIRGQPFLVTDAHVGVCDACGAEHFAAEETARWHQLFEEEQAKRQLSAEDIRRLREDLQLTMEQFAALVGCTRQSLHNWERADRRHPQSRMADLMLKLVLESRQAGKMDVIEFLRDQASRVGLTVPAPGTFDWKPRILKTQRMMVRESNVGITRLAADTESEGESEGTINLADAETKKRVGILSYDFATALLAIEFTTQPKLRRFDAVVRFRDGHFESAHSVDVKDRRAVLLKGRYSPEDVEELAILPPTEDEGAGA